MPGRNLPENIETALRVSGDLSGSLGFPVVRDYPTVLFARTRSGTNDTVDVIAKLSEVA